MTSFSVELDAPTSQLFSYLSDPRHRAEWQSSIIELDLIDDGPARAGFRWREHARGFGRFEMRITEFERDRRWAERGESSRGSIDLALDFFPGQLPDQCRLTVTLGLQLRGLFAATQFAAPLVLRPLMTADLRRAARLASDL